SDLAFVEEDKHAYQLPEIEPRHVERLEQLIDEMTAVVGPLENFILPGGSLGAAQLHVARTVCRRAERDVTTLALEEKVGANALAYLNRLSDALFVMARFENHMQGVPEPLWRPGA
ncbi:MAG: cob(I)yrinic acid a,c-diamide adenosyltransferase, partial [Caldilineaceae bacterium]|nr:cob(I)yrinic acid a,c-diamide adenosyltransferase [Caldilineaceae bacterium]